MKRLPLSDDLVDWVQEHGQAGTIPKDDYGNHVIIGNFSPSMLGILQVPDLQLVTSVSVMEKMMFDHAISGPTIKGLPALLSQPKSIYKSDMAVGSVVIITLANLRGKPVVVPVRLGQHGATGRAGMHWVASAYAKDHTDQLQAWRDKGLLIWE